MRLSRANRALPFLSSLDAKALTRLHHDFALFAHPHQRPRDVGNNGAPWSAWLMLGGRGAGKTRLAIEAAGEIGLQGTPIFTFQEGNDPNAARAFQEMAKLSRGAYFKLNESSAHMLRDLLSAVAVYAAGGRTALEDHAKSKGGSSTLLLRQMK